MCFIFTSRCFSGALRIRSGPSTDTEILGKFYNGTEVQLTGEEGDWYTISYNGATAYLHKDYIRLADEEDEAEESSAGTYSMETHELKASVVDEACTHIGAPYVYGGSSPSGFDCSGFTSYVYKQFGYSINRTASNQLDNGYAVDRSELQPGDLVMFCQYGSTKRASHVGLYIGNNQYVHASTPGVGVIISDMDDMYISSGYVGARRIV